MRALPSSSRYTCEYGAKTVEHVNDMGFLKILELIITEDIFVYASLVWKKYNLHF